MEKTEQLVTSKARDRSHLLRDLLCPPVSVYDTFVWFRNGKKDESRRKHGNVLAPLRSKPVLGIEQMIGTLTEKIRSNPEQILIDVLSIYWSVWSRIGHSVDFENHRCSRYFGNIGSSAEFEIPLGSIVRDRKMQRQQAVSIILFFSE